MKVLILLILASLGVALCFLAAFVWAVRAGQYDDTQTPSFRILGEERTAGQRDPVSNSKAKSNKSRVEIGRAHV